MPKVGFSTDNKVTYANDYPRLKLDHNERALVVCFEPEPEMEFVHTLRAPEIGPDGQVITETKKGKRGEYEGPKLEFIGQHLCFGNFEELTKKGSDPANCPTCKAAAEESGIDAPLPRYAMHVLRYGLEPGGWTVREPFTLTCEAWVFAASRFNQLIDFAAEWEDLRLHDLKLGPCTNKDFQKYDMQVAKEAQWFKSDERKKYAVEVYNNNKSADLSALIGRKITREQAQTDISRVLERLAQASGKPAAATSSSVASAAVSSEVNDLLNGSSDTAPAAEESAPAETPAVSTAKSTSEMSLEDVLSGL